MKSAEDRHIVKAPIRAYSPEAEVVDTNTSSLLSSLVSDKDEEERKVREEAPDSVDSAVVSSTVSTADVADVGKGPVDQEAKDQLKELEEVVVSVAGPVITRGMLTGDGGLRGRANTSG